MVFDGIDLPESPERESEIAMLMAGSSPADGLGGDHYQLNKAAVVWPADDHTFRFRFYQVERTQRRVVNDLECASAASGAAVFALLRGQVQFDGNGAVEALNEGTGQRILLRPENLDSFWNSPWDVRFLLEEGATPRRFSGPAPLAAVASDGGPVRFWVVEQGNVFIFAEVEHARVDAWLVHQLQEAARVAAVRLGSDPARAASPKVIIYEIQSVEAADVHAAVTCFYNGEIHASLPGSAAMCLASFLAGWRLDSIPAVHQRGALVFHFHHGSGVLSVAVHWVRHHGEDRIEATNLTTSVRLLLRGGAVRPTAETRP